MNNEILSAYEKGAEDLSMAIRSLTAADLCVKPAPDANVGLWSIQQIVVHLADAEGVSTNRMKWVIAEENPPLLAFDENLWVKNLSYETRPAEEACKLVELGRRQIVAILRPLPESTLNRAGKHSELGSVSLGDLLKKATKHLAHHVGFIHRKRALMGKEMW